jgi:serine/threonine protein kinase
MKEKGHARQEQDKMRLIEEASLSVSQKSEGSSAGESAEPTVLIDGQIEGHFSGAAERKRYKKGDLVGQCEILDVIGQGGMGCVYKAHDRVLDRIVALKTLTKQMSEESILRFQQEARSLSRLSNPNVVSVYQIGVTEEHIPYMMMEYVDGEPLSEIIARDAPLNPIWVGAMAVQLGNALDAVHSAGIIHRDLKPSNLIVSRNEKGVEILKVIDFGIAFYSTDEQRLTKAGAMLGTPLYMSPEQIVGGELHTTSDVYSMACILYEMFSGHPPYSGSRKEILDQHERAATPPLPKHAKRLQPLLDCAMRKDPSQRINSASKFATEMFKMILTSPKQMFLNAPSSLQANISRKIPGVEEQLPMIRMWAILALLIIAGPLLIRFLPKPYNFIVWLLLALGWLVTLYFAFRPPGAKKV